MYEIVNKTDSTIETTTSNNLDSLYIQSLQIYPNDPLLQYERSRIERQNIYNHDFSGIILRDNPDSDVADKLGLSHHDFDLAITCIGGAVFGNNKLEETVSKFFTAAIHRANIDLTAKNKNLLIGAAGTRGGVMRMMGNARIENQVDGIDFTLLGVIPNERVAYPGNNNVIFRRDKLPLLGFDVANHDFSHLVITQNGYPYDIEGAWHTMSDRLCSLTNFLGAKSRRKTIVVNGGSGTGYELPQKMGQGDDIIVIKGSDRFADALTALIEDRGTDHLTYEQRNYLKEFERRGGDNLATFRHKIKIFDLQSYKNLDLAVNDFKELILE